MADRNPGNENSKTNTTTTGGTQQQPRQQGSSSGSSSTGTSGQTGARSDGKGRERDFATEFEALKSDLAQVRRDLSSLAGVGMSTASGGASSMRDQAKGVASSARDAADSAREGAEGMMGKVRDMSSSAMDAEQAMMEDVRGRVGDHPMSTVAMAMGLGFAIGWIVSRR